MPIHLRSLPQVLHLLYDRDQLFQMPPHELLAAALVGNTQELVFLLQRKANVMGQIVSYKVIRAGGKVLVNLHQAK